VRADVHAPLQRQASGALHGGFVSGVAAAGDVGRGDLLHHRGFVLRIFELAHVAVEVDH